MTMHLRIMLPTEALVDVSARKVNAEAVDGWFCLLPRHIDYVSTLVPGVLTYEDRDGREAFVAVDGGVLVKCGGEVLVSTPRAVAGSELGELQARVALQFRSLDERERATHSALRKLEASFLRGLLRLEEVPGG